MCFPGPWGNRRFLPGWPGKELLTRDSVLGNVWTANLPVLPPIHSPSANLQNPALGQLLYHPQLLEAAQHSACAGRSRFTELNAKLIFFSLVKAHSYAYWTVWKMKYSTPGVRSEQPIFPNSNVKPTALGCNSVFVSEPRFLICGIQITVTPTEMWG